MYYYISNILIYLSHDIIYAINKEVRRFLSKDNNKEEVSGNIYNIIMTSFYYIMEALTDLRSGMFFINLEYSNTNNISKKFQSIFNDHVIPAINYFEKCFNICLKKRERYNTI